jgi:NDP-sugar pyrophosphorylase family protein
LISRRELLAFEVSKRFYDVGSPESLEELKRLLAEGKKHLASLDCNADNLIVYSHFHCSRIVISPGYFHVCQSDIIGKAFFPNKVDPTFQLDCSMLAP